MEDVRKAVTMDAKKAGDLVYVLGPRPELGASEWYAPMALSGTGPEGPPSGAKVLY